MFGPNARASAGSLRRARRRLLLLVLGAAVLALLIGEVADEVVNSAGPANLRSTKSWAAAISPTLYQSNALVGDFSRVLARPGSFSRPSFDLTVRTLAGAAAADVVALGDVGFAAPLPRAASDVESVLGLRARALSSFERASLLATAGDPRAASPLFVAAGADLRRADASFHALRGHLGKLARDLPANGWTSSGGGPTTIAASTLSPVAMANYAHRLASLASLRTRPAVTLEAISLDPAPFAISGLATTTTTTTTSTTTTTTTTVPGVGPGATTSTSTTTTTTLPRPTTTLQIPPLGARSELPPVKSVRVLVIVTNSGNVALTSVRVTAVLSPFGARASAALGTLAVGTSRYVRLGPLLVRRGPTYRLTVHAGASGASATRTVRFSVGP